MKKIKLLIAIIVCGGLAWYLFIKPHDYIVRFTIKTSPGTLLSGVEDWNRINQKENIFSYKINTKVPFSSLSESLYVNKMDLEIDWSFKSLTDTTTQVIAGITEKKNSIYNRITAPFANTLFKKKSIELVQDYKDGIENQLKLKFKVKVVGVDLTPELNYAYVEYKNIQIRNKAMQMMKKDFKLLTYLNKHDLKKGVFPFLIVNNWNLKVNTIDFRYCFPVRRTDSVPFSKDIKFDTLTSKKALKAIYNGNYSSSDRGWFALKEYAKRHNINVSNELVEIYHDNPKISGDEINWKTEVYLLIN